MNRLCGDDPEAHPALHPALAVVPTAPEPMTTLERADPAFDPGTPAESRAGNPHTRLAGLPRQHDVPDLQSWRCLRTSIRQDHGRGRPQSAATLTRRMAPGQGLRHSIDESIDLPKGASQSLSASDRSTSTRLRCRYARRTKAPSVEADRVSRVACAANPRRSITIESN